MTKDKIEIEFNNLEELKDIIYNNIKNIKIKKEDIQSIYDLGGYVYFDISYSHFMDYTYHEHNLLNKTFGKKMVPTVCQNGNIFSSIIYCPHCKQMHREVDYKGSIAMLNDEQSYYKAQIENIKTIICTKCNTEYALEDMKIISGRPEYMCGDIFIDEDKISLSYKYMYNSINRHGNFYYEDGYTRLTLNTKTGYSYTTNKGHAYKELKKTWERYNQVPPVTFNSTYAFIDGTENILHCIIQCRRMNELKKMSKEELLIEIEKEKSKSYYDARIKKENELIKEIAHKLYNKVQQNFSYKLPEYVKKSGDSTNNYASRILKNFNRYVNVDPTHANMNILVNREYEFKKNKIHREEVNLIDSLFKLEGVKLGKKTRAMVQQNIYHRMLFDYLPVILCFKNTSNINKIVSTIINSESKGLNYYYSIDIANTIKIWLNYRDENYIMAKLLEEMNPVKQNNNSFRSIKVNHTKMNLMKDCYYMIKNIQRYLEDFDINEIVNFKNEQQFHDDISRFINSQEYRDLVEKKESSIVFDLEKDLFVLENQDNNIFIARNSGELRKIGREMNICVGGYTEVVKRGNCRIVYIMDKNNKEYKACIELRPKQLKNKTKYSLVQAKLKYNRRPCEDKDIYNKIMEWIRIHNIEINTCDMDLPELKAILKQEAHAI